MQKTSPLRWFSAALLALLVSLGAVTASTACAVAGPMAPTAVAASAGGDAARDADCGDERNQAASDCAKHCAVLCRAIAPAAPSLAAGISQTSVLYFTRPAVGESLAPLPEQPPPR